MPVSELDPPGGTPSKRMRNADSEGPVGTGSPGATKSRRSFGDSARMRCRSSRKALRPADAWPCAGRAANRLTSTHAQNHRAVAIAASYFDPGAGGVFGAVVAFGLRPRVSQ